MNIYDFDNTIFKGDSSIKFIKYSLLRHPFIVIPSMFKSLWECIKYVFHKSDFNKIKSSMFSFVRKIKNIDEYLDIYVDKKMKYIKKFYYENQKDDDVIISATYDFIIKRFCKRLNIKYFIASKYDIKNGINIGNNCKGEEKVKRFYEMFKSPIVNEAYSDSNSDLPMLKLAKTAYLVQDDKLIKLNLNK